MLLIKYANVLIRHKASIYFGGTKFLNAHLRYSIVNKCKFIDELILKYNDYVFVPNVSHIVIFFV